LYTYQELFIEWGKHRKRTREMLGEKKRLDEKFAIGMVGI
jgi:hypothetical protein